MIVISGMGREMLIVYLVTNGIIVSYVIVRRITSNLQIIMRNLLYTVAIKMLL